MDLQPADGRLLADAPPTSPIIEFLALNWTVFDLGRLIEPGMSQSPTHPQYSHSLVERHGDRARTGSLGVATDLIVLGTHVGTHVDAPAHISSDGLLHGGASAVRAQEGGSFLDHGAHRMAPAFSRGVLVDMPALLGVDVCPPAYEITADEVRAAIEVQGIRDIKRGDVVLIRTGWGKHWSDPEKFLGLTSGVPGPGASCANWLVELGVSVVGGDTLAFERTAPGAGHTDLPVHKLLLVDHAIPIIETMNLDELARARCYEFAFVFAPLPLVGATGAPLRPLAIGTPAPESLSTA